MLAIHQYYDGCNGLRTGDTYEGSAEEIAEIVVELHQNDYATYDNATKKCGPWTKDLAVQAIQEALAEREPFVIDPFGDGQSFLALTA